MIEDLGQVQARIAEIQGRLAALSPPAPTAASQAAQTESRPFGQTLERLQDNSAARPLGAPEAARVPAASLGPLPVSPASENVVPVRRAEAGTDAYGGLIDSYAAKNGVAPALVRAVIRAESGGNPRAVSRAGAMGLMQLMPENVQESGITDPFDPEQNIAAGTKQLAGLLSHYHGDLDLALAGYNAGPGNVHKYGGIPPFAETQRYIRKVRAEMERG